MNVCGLLPPSSPSFWDGGLNESLATTHPPRTLLSMSRFWGEEHEEGKSCGAWLPDG